MIVKTQDLVGLDTKVWGIGQPVTITDGWPLNADSGGNVALPLTDSRFQTIAYDRCRLGRYDQPWNSYDYDNLTNDLHDLMAALHLTDAAFVGFSMGIVGFSSGGGEVARSILRHRAKNLQSAILISSVVPYLLETQDNPDGVPPSSLEKIGEGLHADRPKFSDSFFKDFYGVGMLSSPVSDPWLQWTRDLSMSASLRATHFHRLISEQFSGIANGLM